jgi:hypothetical protein
MTMPVEIKELVIRAVVHQQGGQQGDQNGAPKAPQKAAKQAPNKGGGGCGGRFAGAGGNDPHAEEREGTVEAAVREVLRILRASKER